MITEELKDRLHHQVALNLSEKVRLTQPRPSLLRMLAMRKLQHSNNLTPERCIANMARMDPRSEGVVRKLAQRTWAFNTGSTRKSH